LTQQLNQVVSHLKITKSSKSYFLAFIKHQNKSPIFAGSKHFLA